MMGALIGPILAIGHSFIDDEPIGEWWRHHCRVIIALVIVIAITWGSIWLLDLWFAIEDWRHARRNRIRS
jgi:hypothetical protein